MSKAALLEKLTDKEYRDAFVSEEIDVGIPMQLRSMRDARGWKQSYVAEKTNTKQPRFSLMEKPGYGNFSLNTLKKLASLFDVGLIVSFVPFSEMIDFVESMGPKRLLAPSFTDEWKAMYRRFNRDTHTAIRSSTTTTQFSFDFDTTNTARIGELAVVKTATSTIRESFVDEGYRDVPMGLIAQSATAANTITL